MNIFVTKLNRETDDYGLKEAFENYGEVTSSKVIMDRESGRSKCFGFVEMANDEEAKEAIAQLDGTELDGFTIVVKQAEPRERRDNNRGGGGGFRRNDNNDRRRY
ncbi:RNA-binding protein [Weeksellaceae bacterium KMM 9713]|uniref:RNA-binding protein n=1 Tax=Profundicola chukchiensis TaxID=2961959 RepID=A0A9X4MYC0_9FLAO|nr:RNA-binding protein [Profundicola chukchiensis]MDG4946353.1 RNA-binding protein [Profundicola chukchiensis]MDG4950892.1 RNA-binding protein [Profundicola chukchiensis]